MKHLIVTFCLLSSATCFGQGEVTVNPEVREPKAAESVVADPKDPIYEVPDVMAEFPGGRGMLKAFITENLMYPQFAREARIQGKCYLRLVIDKQGKVSRVEVTKGVHDCPECDNEAVRLVKQMPQWIPASINGKAVNSYYVIPIDFILPE